MIRPGGLFIIRHLRCKGQDLPMVRSRQARLALGGSTVAAHNRTHTARNAQRAKRCPKQAGHKGMRGAFPSQAAAVLPLCRCRTGLRTGRMPARQDDEPCKRVCCNVVRVYGTLRKFDVCHFCVAGGRLSTVNKLREWHNTLCQQFDL